MSTPPEKPKGRIDSLLADEALYTVREPEKPRALPDFVEKHLQAAKQKRIRAAEELPPRPRWPMLSGILTFPFYLNTLGPWMFITLGLMVFGWLLMFWIENGAVMGASSAYYLGLPPLAVGLLTLGYAASCCFSIIEGTCSGWDSFEVSPGGEWKEWVWNFAHIIALLLQAAVVGLVVKLVSFSDSWLTMAVGTFAAFPLVLLGALAGNGAWVPVAIGIILRSLVPLWWAWSLFYLETGVMIVGCTILTKAGLGGQAYWLTPLYAGPLLATVIIIYARLAGRLAGCIAAATTKTLTKGDEDEKP